MPSRFCCHDDSLPHSENVTRDGEAPAEPSINYGMRLRRGYAPAASTGDCEIGIDPECLAVAEVAKTFDLRPPRRNSVRVPLQRLAATTVRHIVSATWYAGAFFDGLILAKDVDSAGEAPAEPCN